MGLDILAYGVEESAALVLDSVASEKGLGHMSSARWNELHKQMVMGLMVKAEGSVEGAFDTQFFAPNGGRTEGHNARALCCLRFTDPSVRSTHCLGRDDSAHDRGAVVP